MEAACRICVNWIDRGGDFGIFVNGLIRAIANDQNLGVGREARGW